MVTSRRIASPPTQRCHQRRRKCRRSPTGLASVAVGLHIRRDRRLLRLAAFGMHILCSFVSLVAWIRRSDVSAAASLSALGGHGVRDTPGVAAVVWECSSLPSDSCDCLCGSTVTTVNALDTPPITAYGYRR